MANPYQTPESDLQVSGVATHNPDYAGFWIRVGASLIDSILLMIIIMPLLFLIYGERIFVGEAIVNGIWDVLLSYVFPIIASILFWVYRSATPGKILLNLKIVNADDGSHPKTSKFIIRYFAYFLSMIPLFLGFVWVAFDQKKQGWHDKLANTVVIKE